MKIAIFTSLALIAGLAIGGILGMIASPYRHTESRLIDAWRQITPGMEVSAVADALGEPMYRFPPGEGWPAWATRSLPKDLETEFGLEVYYIGGFGPQLLLVVHDAPGEVRFVSSTYT